MTRKPSPETELRRVKRELKHWCNQHTVAVTLASDYRARATKAEQDAAEWKRRFDALLKILPEQKT